MPVHATALACEGERGMVIADAVGKGDKDGGEIPLPHTNSSGLILASLQICFTIFGCRIFPA
jgi:hypothetical protein